MVQNKIEKKDYLTLSKFAKKHGIDTKNKDKKDLLLKAMRRCNQLQIKNPAGNMVDMVYKNTTSHNSESCWWVPPFSDEPVYKKYKEFEAQALEKAKGTEK